MFFKCGRMWELCCCCCCFCSCWWNVGVLYCVGFSFSIYLCSDCCIVHLFKDIPESWNYIFWSIWSLQKRQKFLHHHQQKKSVYPVSSVCSRQPCQHCQKNHPATNPPLSSMLNNGWRKPTNPRANGLYSRLSARILTDASSIPLTLLYTHFKCTLYASVYVCVSMSACVYMRTSWHLKREMA